MGIIKALIRTATWRIGLKLLVAIVGIELVIMLALTALRLDTGPWWVGVGDAFVLGVCSSVLIYFWVVRPLERASRQNELFQTVVNTLPVGVVVTDRMDGEHAIISVNPAFTRITGYEAQEVLGRHPRLLQAREDVDEVALERARKAMREQRPVRLLQRNRRKDGAVFWNELHLSPIIDASGRASRWVGLMHDVTERKELEDEVRRLAHAVEQADEAICTFDVEGRIDFCNPAFCRNVGLDASEARGQRVWRFWLEGEAADAAKRAVAEERPWSGRHRRRRADGVEYEALTTLSPVCNAQGAVMHYLALHRDISDMVGLEREMMHAQRMEAVGTLAGGIAHDFNNMLAGMLGHLYLMKNAVRDRPQVLDRIQIIEKQGHRAANLIRQLLTFARKSDVEKKPFDMRSFTKEIAKFVEPAVPENIRVTLDIADVPMPIEGDAGQIQQCILNLISNARHAIEDRMAHEDEDWHGEIRLIVRPGGPGKKCPGLCCESGRPDWCVEVRVEDNGCGMDEATRARIFEPYFTTKQLNRGTGLGLPMVMGCVEMHGGCILVDSTPGGGSAFSMLFPALNRDREDAGTDGSKEALLPAGDGALVLVADDNEPMLQVLQEVLEHAGYRVLPAGDGEEAIRVFQEHRDKLRMAFVDKVMPGRDGLAVARHIHMSRPDVGLVLMTGYEMTDTLSQDPLVTAGALRLMHKPWRMDELGRLLRDMMNGREARGLDNGQS